MSFEGRNYCATCTFRTALVLFGGFLVHLALGAMYTFGNFAPYFISYIRNRTDDTEIRNVDSLWINAAGTVGNCVGLTVGGIFAHLFGARIATLIGSVVFCGSIGANYFSVNHSFIAVVFTYGLTGYLGHKLTYGTPVQTAIKWLPEHSTLAAGIIVSGTGGGSLIFNQVITGYINPDNLSPDLITADGGRYFTQPELLDRVPTCFLILSASYFALQLIGIACISDPPNTSSQDPLHMVNSHEESVGKPCVELKWYKNSEDSPQHIDSGVKKQAEDYDNFGYVDVENVKVDTEKNADVPNGGNACVSNGENAGLPNGENACVPNGENAGVPNGENSGVPNGVNAANKKNEDDVSVPEELGIIEAIKYALRCRSFYVVWLTIMLMNGGMQFINGLYKAYGQTFIADDHFLALTGSLAAIFNCIGRPIWGAVMDRAGFRVAVRCVSGGFVIMLATLILTEHLPKYLFLVWICALYFFFCGIWSIMPATLAKLLGPQHMAINYGIIYTGLSVVSILGSLFGTSLKAMIGWHGLFYMAAGLGALVFLVTFLFNGIDRNGKEI